MLKEKKQDKLVFQWKCWHRIYSEEDEGGDFPLEGNEKLESVGCEKLS